LEGLAFPPGSGDTGLLLLQLAFTLDAPPDTDAPPDAGRS